MIKNPKNWSLKSKVTWSFMIVVLCIALVISLLYYRSQRKQYENNLSVTDRNDITYLMGNMEKQLALCEKLSDWIYVNRKIETALVRDYENDMGQYSRDIPPTQRLIDDQLVASSVGKYVIFLYVQGYNGVAFKANTDAYWLEDLTKHPWHTIGMQAGGAVVWSGITENPATYKTTDMIIPLVRPVIFSDNRVKIGWQVLAFSPALITDVFQDYRMDQGRSIVVIDQNGRAVFHNDPTMVGSYVEYDFFDEDMQKGDGNRHVIHDGKKTLVTYKHSPHTGMTMLLFHSLADLEKQAQFLLFVLVVIFLLTAVMFFFLTYYLSNQLTKPLAGILEKLKDVSMGDFQMDNSINGNDEMGLIGRGVNEMAGNIGSLMGELIEREHEKCELEYRVLLNQINPHFVYNVLNSIKVMADIQKIEGISEMASSLGTLLKEISKGVAEQVTIRRELELLDKYFYLQKIRKCGLLTIIYDIPDESVLDFLIPRFTLQPLAENSIYHGLDNVSRMGIITISITAQQEEVIIVISDNGSGISREKIAELLSAESMDGKEMTHVGLVNVDKRIKLFYGCGSLAIDSIVGESTSVTLRFPKILQGEPTQQSAV